jgi:hypothetical protein
VGAEMIAEVVNSFVEPISWKTLVRWHRSYYTPTIHYQHIFRRSRWLHSLFWLCSSTLCCHCTGRDIIILFRHHHHFISSHHTLFLPPVPFHRSTSAAIYRQPPHLDGSALLGLASRKKMKTHNRPRGDGVWTEELLLK